MMEQNKEANWKKSSELDYNLNSKYMDFEDKWKKALGQDLYKEKATNLAVDPQMR